jgi:hypothetical protein
MDKKLIIRFLKEKRHGAYNLLVEFYAPQIFSFSKTMALTLIEEDLEREVGSPMKLSYFNLARAMRRYQKKHPKVTMSGSKQVFEFKDAYELKEGQSSPIMINLPPKK